MTEIAVNRAPPSYLQRAFFSQYNLILFAGSALFSLAAASPLPLLMGACTELLWLTIGPRLHAFQRHVDQTARAAHDSQREQEPSSGMQALDADHARRVVAFGNALSELRGLALKPVDAETRALHASLAELERLRPAYLRLCTLHQSLSRSVAEGTAAHAHEIARLTQAHAAEKDLALKLSLRQLINAAQRAVDEHARRAETLRLAEHKLALLERSVSHLQAQRLTHAPPQEVARAVQELLAQIPAADALGNES